MSREWKGRETYAWWWGGSPHPTQHFAEPIDCEDEHITYEDIFNAKRRRRKVNCAEM